MRKRPILLAAAVAVTGLVALGTVVAQQPSGGGPLPPPLPPPAGGYTQPPVAPAGLPVTPVVRPAGSWTPTSPAAGYTPRPAGGTPAPKSSYPPPSSPAPPASYYPAPGGGPSNTRPLPPAGSSGVIPASGAIPPPSMEGFDPSVKPAAAPGAPLPPPSVSLDAGDNKFPLAPVPPPPPVGGLPASGGVIPPAPPAGLTPPPLPGEKNLTPTPVLPGGPAGPVPTPGAIPVPPVGLPAMPGATPPGGPPKALPVPPGSPAAESALMPTKVSQSVTVEAVCPATVVYGAQLEYQLVVRNAGNVAVQNVRVEDELPGGARYVGSDPPGEISGSRLVWSLGAMDGHAEKRIVVRVRPNEEGELRSRAAVSFSAAVEAKTKVTRPRVAVSVSGPEVSRVGEEAVFRVTVANSGTGPAEHMVLSAVVSEGLYHPQGTKLESKLANLAAGDHKTIDLPLSAVKAGLQWCQVAVTAEGSQGATAKAQVNVVEPQLQITQEGPAKCLVRGEPTYEITLSNPGTASTDAITLNAEVPDGFDFVQASDSGSYNATSRVVTWKLSALPAGGTKGVAVKLRAAASGDVVLRTTAISAPERGAIAPAGGAKPAGRVLAAKGETPIKAEGVAAVRFEVKDLEDPVEVGKEAVYEIRVTNQGTGVCSNVQLMAALAEGTTFTGANGPTTVKAQGQTLVFEPIASLAVKGETVYTVRVRGNVAGDQRFRVQLTCDQIRTPVIKEESTNFYKQ